MKYKLLFWVWISTSLATTLFTSIQVYSEYAVDMNFAKKQLIVIEQSYMAQIKESLWDFNTKNAYIQAESISKLTNVSFVKLFIGDKDIYSKGDFLKEQKNGVKEYVIEHNGKTLGKLIVQLNLKSIQKGYINKILKIFALQSIKTFIVCWLLLFIFSKLVVNHIFRISKYMNSFNVEDQDLLVLDRKEDESDELSMLVKNINTLRRNLFSANEKNKTFTENLEQIVDERTRELEDARAKAIHSSRLEFLGEMASGIAHEINNPLAIISSYMRTMRRAKSKDKLTNELFEEIVVEIESTVKRIDKVVSGLRTVSKDSDKLIKSPISIREIFENISDLYKEKYKSNGIEFILNLESEELNKVIFADHVQVTHAVINLISNSSEAIENLEKKWIKLEVEESESAVIIKVIDSGNGIDNEVFEKMFNPFYTSKDIGKGTGLGLSISRNIIESNGGTLELDKENPNTCFKITLPLSKELDLKTKKVS